MGSIEYAVEHLDTKLIVVLGHTECGAIKAYVGDKNNEYKKHRSHIDDIVETIANESEEKQISKENHLDACISCQHQTLLENDSRQSYHKRKTRQSGSNAIRYPYRKNREFVVKSFYVVLIVE